MKNLKSIVFVLFIIIAFSCENSNEDAYNGIFAKGELAQISISSISNIRDTSASIVCVLDNKGKGFVSAKGVCWSATQQPDIEDSYINIKDTGKVVILLKGLRMGTIYYVRPFIKNITGINYGEELSFTTDSLPTVSSSGPFDLTSTSANIIGNVVKDGGDSVTVRGLCWDTSADPTIALTTKTVNGSDIGTFTANITSLTAGKTYYVRTYATNSVGTGYGNQIIFSTQDLPKLSTNAVTDITTVTASSGGNISSDGGAYIMARGICWSTNQEPTIVNSKTTNGNGVGSYSSLMLGLQLGTVYFVRAYATNSVGTAYGEQQSFKTNSYATLSTKSISNIGATTATCGGTITADGGTTVTARGVCYSASSNPTISNFKTSDGTGTGTFTSTITGLMPDIEYYVRAYATNTAGTEYGNEMSFTTLTTPSVSTGEILSITSNSAISGGNISSDGGATISARGVCWSTNMNPTLSNSKTIDGKGTGFFYSTITGLTAGITYYVRAYATNTVGTSYGSELSFITASLPSLSTTSITSITSNSAISGGNISSDGGATITTRGVCWSTSVNPTISNSRTYNGTGTGSFSSSITGLSTGTTYYVRAYATNSVGTSYGNQVSFVSIKTPETVTDIDGNIYHTVIIGSQVWMVENLKVTHYRDGTSIPNIIDNNTWSTTTIGAYCDYENDPTYSVKYGRLYNWNAVKNVKNIAPIGWHIATREEYYILSDFAELNPGISGNCVKALAAKTDWTISTNIGAVGNNLSINNSTGFSALPGGYRHYQGDFGFISDMCVLWMNNISNNDLMIYADLNQYNSGVWTISTNFGESVRCIKD